MTLSLTSLLIIMISTGLCGGFMSGLLGIGGGTIIVPVLFFLFQAADVPHHIAMPMALATTLAVLVLTTTSSALSHFHLGHCNVSIVKRYVPWMMGGALMGSQIAGRIDAQWLIWIFPFFLCYIAIRLSELFVKPTVAMQDHPLSSWAQRFYALFFGNLAIFLGLSGGILLVPHFVKQYQLTMHQAIGTATACGFGTALVGMFGYMLYASPVNTLPGGMIGYIYWPAALVIGISGLFTAPLGAVLAKKLPTLLLKRIFAGFLVIVAFSMWTS